MYCTHADRKSEERQKKLKDFIATCRAKKIFVCVFESGDGDLSETTKELLAYNYQNAVTSAAKPHCSGKKCDFQPLKPIYTPYNRCVKPFAEARLIRRRALVFRFFILSAPVVISAP